MKKGRKNKTIKAITATSVAVVMSTSVLPTVSTPFLAQAEETNTLLGSESSSPYEFRRGSVYWTTSNIREWLNSDTERVTYTNDAPDESKLGSRSYASEPGFLNGFSSAELNGIAVTQRRSFVSTNLGGGSWEGGSASVPRYDGLVPSPFFQISSPNIHAMWKSIYYQTVNDKVFTLAPNELYEYVQKRGITYQKGLTEEAKRQFNISSDSYSYSTSSYNYSNRNSNSLWGIDSQGRPGYSDISGNNGIVPALHLKADYVLTSGKKARDLKVGELVTFGSYNNAPIEWRVINVTPEGYPLLWAEKILTLKAYDAPGQLIYKNSNSVNFMTSDVSIKDDLKFTNEKTDMTEPTIRVVNASALSERQNGNFTITIEASDSESGIDHIIMPDGTKVYKTSVEFEVTKNGRYYFTAVDKAGNYYGFEVPVGNINPPANVIINTSANGWTNKDVTVDIATTQANTTWTKSLVQTPKSSGSGMVFPEYTSYAGKQFRITGQVRKVSAVDDKYNAVVRMIYDVVIPFGNNYRVSKTYPITASIPIKNLSTTDYTSFDTVFTVDGNYFGGLYPSLTTTASGIDSSGYQIEWKDVKVELLDKEDFSIQKIILPNGTEIQSNSYRDVLTQEGTYTYKVLDSRGKITEKTVEVKIDKVAPTLSITGVSSTPTNQDVILKVSSTDSQSGVKRIQKPNGEWQSVSSMDYLISQNGSYTFTVEDNAGNIKTQTVTVSNIDKTPPSDPIIQPSTSNPTNQNVSVEIEYATDSVKKEYRVNGGGWTTYSTPIVMTSNGTVEARATDSLGNVSYVSRYQVNNIDKVVPNSPSVVADVTNPTNKDVKVTVNYSTDSVTKQHRINSGAWQTYSSPITMPSNGLIEARGYDQAGNVSSVTSYTVENIDKVIPYSLEKPYSIEGTLLNNNEYKIVIKGVKDDDSGIKKVVFPTWTASSTTYTSADQDDLNSNWSVTGYDGVETAEGTWEFTVKASDHNNEDGFYHTHVYGIDNAGNRQSLGGVIVQLDRVSPNETTFSANKSVITNTDVTVTMTYPEDAVLKEYRIDSGNWTSYTTPLLMTRNGKIEARSFDQAGNQSNVTSYVVSNIDKVAPTTPILTSSTNMMTNEDVEVNIQYPNDAVVRQYRVNDGVWQSYTDSIVMEDNGKVEARGIDEAGNISAVGSLTLSNIDKVAPTSPILAPSKSIPTNQNVSVSVSYPTDSKLKEYRMNNGDWKLYSTPVVFEENGSIEARATDEAGNVSSVSRYQVNNIDKIAPVKPVATADVTEVTNQDVMISVSYPSDAKVKQVRKDGGSWTVYSGSVLFSKNGKLEARAYDEAGNVSVIETYSVMNIDKVAPNEPQYSVVENQNKFFASKDTDAVLLYRLNGGIWNTYNGEVQLQDGTYSVELKALDEAGNVSPVKEGSFVMYRQALTEAESKVSYAENNITQENVDVAYTKVEAVPHDKPEYSPLMKRLDDLQALLDAQKAIEKAIESRSEADVQVAQEKINLLNNSNPVIIVLMDDIQQDFNEADILSLVAKERYDILSAKYEMSKVSYTALVQIYYAIKYTGDNMYKMAQDKVALVPSDDKYYDFVHEQYDNLIADYDQFVEERIQTDAEIKAEASVQVMEGKYDPTLAVNTQNLINAVENQEIRSSLQKRLDDAKKKYEASLLAKAEQDAITSVEKAESTKNSYYVSEAYKKVNYLTNVELKFELTTRLQTLEAQMAYERQVADATRLVQFAEQYKSQYYIDLSQKKIDALPDGEDKTSLQQRLDVVKSGLTTADQATVIKNATNYVSLAQTMKTQYYVDKAQGYVNQITDPVKKSELQAKLDAIVIK